MSVIRSLRERPREISPGVQVGRVLPSPPVMHVGPFVFLDHAPPRSHPPGEGADVPPHPHIGLATVTYLFEGAVLHRDSLGSEKVIRPGAIHWMSAGRGIVHSERTPPEVRVSGSRSHGLQLWVGVPKARELDAPEFRSYASGELPELTVGKARVRLLAGEAFGARSPVETASPTLFADAQLPAGAELTTPALDEEAIFVVGGTLRCEGAIAAPGTMLLLAPGATPSLVAEEDARFVVLGGARLNGPRYIWWNFVSSEKERIVAAARAWRAGEFPDVPGDDGPGVPLDDEPHFSRE
jgi:redox-sensitive bicupin YhaK (pirin superfamily)